MNSRPSLKWDKFKNWYNIFLYFIPIIAGHCFFVIYPDFGIYIIVSSVVFYAIGVFMNHRNLVSIKDNENGYSKNAISFVWGFTWISYLAFKIGDRDTEFGINAYIKMSTICFILVFILIVDQKILAPAFLILVFFLDFILSMFPVYPKFMYSYYDDYFSDINEILRIIIFVIYCITFETNLPSIYPKLSVSFDLNFYSRSFIKYIDITVLSSILKYILSSWILFLPIYFSIFSPFVMWYTIRSNKIDITQQPILPVNSDITQQPVNDDITQQPVNDDITQQPILLMNNIKRQKCYKPTYLSQQFVYNGQKNPLYLNKF